MPIKSMRMTWWATFVASSLLFATTAHWYGITNIDTMGAAWPAWNLVNHGTLFLEHTSSRPDIPWFYESGEHVVSNRTAGVVLASVPAQGVLAGLDAHPLTAAVLTAVVLAAASLANVMLLLRRLSVRPRDAGAVVVVLGLGTGFWTNASAELWPHAPDAFWLTSAMLAAQRNRLWLAGACLSPAIWTRPHLALVAASLGVAVALTQRQLRPLAAIGLPTAAASALLVAWNRWYFGEATVGGGYASREALVTDVSTGAVERTVASAAGSLFSPLHGLFVYSPFMVVGVVTAAVGWRHAPGWMRGSAVGGLLYLLMQWRLNSFTGGTGLYGYRLQLETVVLLAPLAYVGYAHCRERRLWLQVCTRLLCGAAVAIHVIGVYWYRPLEAQNTDLDPWRRWEPWEAALSRGGTGTVLAVVLVVLFLGLSLLTLEHWRWLRDRVNGRAGAMPVLPGTLSAESPS